ncbi:S41 family peptidase [Clostridium algidicarnis]|uniref:S41 family peptidase n=1 Tax=Clostridium algidicarnis TaxID=37659 RepID=UPI003FD6C29F
MKRKIIIFVGLTLSILVCITVILLNKSFVNNNYKVLFEKVGNQNEYYTEDTIDLNNYMYEHDPKELGIPEDSLQYINIALDTDSFLNDNNLIELDKNDAISDVNFLFNLLKYSYAGYSYFGGDITFENAKENIIKSINSHPAENINSSQLENILDINTKFIQDGHFSINNNSPLNHYLYYSNESICVNKSKNGYYIIENGERLYIKSINDSYDFNNYLKLSINSKGYPCYHIGILDNSNNPSKIKVIFQSQSKEVIKHIDLKKGNPKVCSDDKLNYKYSKRNDVPIITMRKMYDTDVNDKSTKLFAESAISLKDEPVMILDIRGNSGGQDIAPITWFENFTGEIPQIESYSLQLCSLINNYIARLAMKNIDYEILPAELKKEYDEEMQKANVEFNTWYASKTEEKRHKNNTIIFVLIDNKVASSGESFINYLKTLENVILVGTNTSGVYISNVYTRSQLSSSHININFGNTIILNKYCEEGKGFQPDIWIDNEDSLDRVLKLINQFRINPFILGNI